MPVIALALILLWSGLLFGLARRGFGWLAAGLGLASLALWVVYPLSARPMAVPFVWGCALAGGGFALLLARGWGRGPAWMAGGALALAVAGAVLAGIGPAGGNAVLMVVPLTLLALLPALFGGLIGAGWGLWLHERSGGGK